MSKTWIATGIGCLAISVAVISYVLYRLFTGDLFIPAGALMIVGSLHFMAAARTAFEIASEE